MSTHLSSFGMSIFLLSILGVSTALATFIENDFGTQTAQKYIYEALWFEILLAISAAQMLFVIFKRKPSLLSPRVFIHLSLVLILLGAGLTRYFGFEGIISIREGKSSSLVLSSKKYLHVRLDGKSFYFPYKFTAFSDTITKTVSFNGDNITITLAPKSFQKDGRTTQGNLLATISLEDTTQEFTLKETQHALGSMQSAQLQDIHVAISYGSKPLVLPFAIKLKDFVLEHYPGSTSVSSYSSDIIIIDSKQNVKTAAKVFMNNTFIYSGYKFFQTSYDKDELGTILTVNKDPGKIPTYIGYGILFLSIILNFFAPNSRFTYLRKRLKNSYLPLFILTLIPFMPSTTHAQSDYVQNYIQEHSKHSKELAESFSALIVQSRTGRMKPLDTLNREVLYKLSGKSSLYGMDPNQIALGMFTRKDIWERLDIIKIKSPKLKELIGVPKEQNLISFRDLFYGKGNYKIERYVAQANQVSPAFRDTFEKDLIKVDERTNIAFMAFRGSLLKIFPLANNQENRWVDFKTFWKMAEDDAAKKIRQDAERLLEATFNRQYDKGVSYVKNINSYQHKVSSKIIPKKTKIIQELWFNKAKIFPRLSPAYLLLGIVILVYAFISLFAPTLYNRYIVWVFSGLVITLFAIHTLGLAMRWNISGFAPMSNTYESIIYIAWSSMLAGILFFHRSLFALSAATLMAGVFMLAAHLSHIDPEITNLVPVLKSFWLTVHVSIITASYGFLGVGALLGMMGLVIFIFIKKSNTYAQEQLKALTDINEMALWIGLGLLVIGNFLGGIWANESWGRYWGWDPKETWTFISIIVYAVVSHLRLAKSIYSPYLFNALSLVAFGSILMTYFGVNFYLAGMHSYATGDPVPIPTWVYGASAFVIGLIILAYPKRKIIQNHN